MYRYREVIKCRLHKQVTLSVAPDGVQCCTPQGTSQLKKTKGADGVFDERGQVVMVRVCPLPFLGYVLATQRSNALSKSALTGAPGHIESNLLHGDVVARGWSPSKRLVYPITCLPGSLPSCLRVHSLGEIVKISRLLGYCNNW